MRVLVVNAGSSSLKLRLLDGGDAVAWQEDLDSPDGRPEPGALEAALERLEPVDAVGHRIVHGGERFTGPVRVDGAVEDELRALCDLAPLHQPAALAALDAVGAALPGVPAVACFDTAFHATLEPAASTYAIPRAWRRDLGARRFGFHGLSHAYVARRAAQLAGAAAPRLVSCHLGAGASLCAVRDGRSVDTTMGFTPLEGLVMATRSGSVDPGLVLWLLEHAGLDAAALGDAFEHGSGLLALAGTADMRVVLARAEHDDEEARIAVAVYVHRLRAGVAAMAAALGGLDVLAFTGGVGERASALRADAVGGLAFLGAALDGRANFAADDGRDTDVGRPGAAVRTFVIGAREDLEIAAQVRAVLV